MSKSIEQLDQWIADTAASIKQNIDPNPEQFIQFTQDPTLALHLIELIHSLDESTLDEDSTYYSACLFALDLCTAQLQSAVESEQKLAKKTLNALMEHLALAIEANDRTLSFWLPVLNAFYDVNAELSERLKIAYMNLASDETENDFTEDEEQDHLSAICELLKELSDLSVFDVTENFFAQSYAMPPDFFSDLVFDLYSIEQGLEVAVLTLLHPKQEVRDMVVAAHDHIINQIHLNSISLSRLQAIKEWYPPKYHAHFNHWIRQQRKKGIVFMNKHDDMLPELRIKATEVDGSGAQGIFIHFKKNRQHRLCGLLYKQNVGIKDAWITPVIKRSEVKHYFDDAFDDSVMLRNVDLYYFITMTNHFLNITIEQGIMPDLHLLEIQEELHLNFKPEQLNYPALLETIGVQISPFTPDIVHTSLQRSKTWPKNKRFTESWYLENELVDKLVNRCCHFIDGTKVCRFNEAMDLVFSQEMELNREHWLSHFLWITLWLKAGARKTESAWKDSFFIAHAIHSGMPLHEIPIMVEICRESIINSIETMNERRTHIHQE